MSSWATLSRFRIFFLVVLIIAAGIYLFYGAVISERIVGNPDCLRGVTDLRCYAGKKIAFGKVEKAENSDGQAVLVQHITNTLPFGYKGTQMGFDVYDEKGTFITTFTKTFDIAPLGTTLVVLDPGDVAEEPAAVVPLGVSLGKPVFVALGGQQRIFTNELFSVVDAKFGRSITIPITIHLSNIPQKQDYVVLVTGTTDEGEVMEKIYDTTVYFAEKDSPKSTVVTGIDEGFTVTNVLLSCTSYCL